MSPVHVKVGGAWKQASSIYTKVGGVWKTATDMPVKIGGAWKTNILGVPSDFEHIQTITVGAGGAASVTFSSIPQTYKHLQIRSMIRNTDTGASNVGTALRCNSDGGTNYATHYLFGEGSNTFSGAITSNTYIATGDSPTAGMTASTFAVYISDFLDYANASKYKTVRTLSGFDRNGGGVVSLTSGVWMNTAAINGVTLLPYGGAYAQYSTFALYGVKG